MFQLNQEEFEHWISQIVISYISAKISLRKRPFAFSEQGVSMLAAVLHSDRAIRVNIAIMRAFVKMRQLLVSNEKMAQKMLQIEERLDEYDDQFKVVFAAIKKMMEVEEKPKRPIGFIQ